MNTQPLPPAPKPGQPVTVPMDILPEWLAYHALTITGFDARGYYVTQSELPASKPARVGDEEKQ